MTAGPPFAWARGGRALAWGGVAASVALAPWLGGAPLALLLLPLALSTVVFGLPHGALDVFVPFWMERRPLRAGRLALYAAAYLAAAGATLVAWWAAPTAAALGFIALTWFHWGQGDLFALRGMRWDGHLRTPAQRALAVAVRGALPMAVPLLAFPQTYADVVGAMAGALLGDGAPARAAVLGLPHAEVALGLGALWAASLAAGAWAARASRQPRRAWRTWALDAAEVAGLAVFFAVVPPLWAVGVYFCLWHAVRHLERLGPLQTRPASAWRLAAAAAPLSAGALALIAGLAVTVGATADRPLDAAGLYLVGIAALTVPHVLVVVWMDVRQRVWVAPVP